MTSAVIIVKKPTRNPKSDLLEKHQPSSDVGPGEELAGASDHDDAQGDNHHGGGHQHDQLERVRPHDRLQTALRPISL